VRHPALEEGFAESSRARAEAPELVEPLEQSIAFVSLQLALVEILDCGLAGITSNSHGII